MHELEPFYNWRYDYIASEDEKSPFYRAEYSEFEFDKQVYNFLIHPQWDDFGSQTLYLKILYTDYDIGYTILEFIGEWNDALYNDIMLLKREIIDLLLGEGIRYFILIGENVLNFHASDDLYYEEWFQDVEEGWIAALHFPEHVQQELIDAGIDYYLNLGGMLNEIPWRTLKPLQLFQHIDRYLQRRIGP